MAIGFDFREVRPGGLRPSAPRRLVDQGLGFVRVPQRHGELVHVQAPVPAAVEDAEGLLHHGPGAAGPGKITEASFSAYPPERRGVTDLLPLRLLLLSGVDTVRRLSTRICAAPLRGAVPSLGTPRRARRGRP